MSNDEWQELNDDSKLELLIDSGMSENEAYNYLYDDVEDLPESSQDYIDESEFEAYDN